MTKKITNTNLGPAIDMPIVATNRGIDYTKDLAINQFDNANIAITKEVVLNRKDLFTKVNQVMTAGVEIKRTKSGLTAGLMAILQGENSFYAEAGCGKKMMKLNNKKVTLDRFTTDYISVWGDTLETVEGLEGKEIFIHHGKGQVFINRGEKKLNKATQEKAPAVTNLTTGNLVFLSSKDVQNAVKYNFFTSTTSLVKSFGAIWKRAELGSTNEIFNRHIGNIIENLEKEVTVVDAIKIIGRPSLALTKSNRIARNQNIAVYTGNFDNAILVDENGNQILDKKGRPVQRNTWDGAIVARASYIQRLFNLATLADAQAMVIQARFSGVYKFQVIVVPDTLFDEYEKDCVSRKDGDFSRIGTQDRSDFLIDSNAVKANIDTDHLTFNLMSFGKATPGKTSKQMLEKVIVESAMTGKYDSCMRYLEKVAMMHISRVMDQTLDTEVKEMKLQENRDSNGEIKAPYIGEVIKSICPDNPIMLNQQIQDSVNTLAKDIDKLAIRLKDEATEMDTIYNAVVASDPAAIFGVNIIPKDKVFFGKFSKELSRLKNKYGADSEQYKNLKSVADRFVAIKYPSMYFREFAAGTILELDEAITLINENTTLTEAQKAGLRAHFRGLCDASVCFPAYRDIFDTLAGMDIDFDKIVLVFDKFICDLLIGKQERIEIDAEGGDTEKTKNRENNRRAKAGEKKMEANSTFAAMRKSSKTAVSNMINTRDEKFAEKMFMKSIKFEGQIGIITFYNNRVIAILTALLRGDNTAAKHFMREVCNKTKGEKRSWNVDTSRLTPAVIDEMIEEMQTIEWSDENVREFLIACSKAFRLYQETAIDAAKTGIYLTTLITVKAISVRSLTHINAVYNEDEQGVMLIRDEFLAGQKVKIVEGAEKRELEVIELADGLSELQDFMVNIVNINVKDEYDNVDLAYNKDQVNLMQIALDAVIKTKAGRELVELLHQVKSVYVQESVAYQTAIRAIDKKASEEKRKSIIESLKGDYKVKMASFSNTLRRLIERLENFDDAEKGAVILAINCSKRNGVINPLNKNRMAYTLAPEYMMAFFASQEVTAYGTVIQEGEEVEGTIKLEKGVSSKGLVIKENYTGEVSYVNGVVSAQLGYKEISEVDDERYMVIIPGGEDLADKINRNSLVYMENGKVNFIENQNESMEPVEFKAIFSDLLETVEYEDGTEEDVVCYIDGCFTTVVSTEVAPTIINGRTKRNFKEVECLVLDLSFPME